MGCCCRILKKGVTSSGFKGFKKDLVLKDCTGYYSENRLVGISKSRETSEETVGAIEMRADGDYRGLLVVQGIRSAQIIGV